MEMEHGRLRSHPAPTADMEYLLVVDGVQEDMVASEMLQVTGHVHR